NGYLAYRPSAWIAVDGEDSFDFLQSQFSNDLGGVAIGEGKYGLWLDQKGRVQGDSYVLRTDDERFILFSPITEENTIVEKLEKHIIADDVELEGQGDRVSAFCILGSGMEVLNRQGWPKACPGSFNFEGHAVYLLPGRRGKSLAVEIIVPVQLNDFFEETLQKSAPDIGELTVNEMEAYRILSRTPAVPLDIGPGELPQEGGLEKEAVSFDKGCYLGQEVMSRLHSIGQARRSLRLVRYENPVEMGQVIYHEGKKAGFAKSSTVFEGIHFGLALLTNTVSPASKLKVGDPETGFAVTLLS
ncbi:MAG: hypothetical protein KJT03_22845, partial [Verrucomicrobiae bacterium]|nr:hypothetical protein [Verrucomicrobiae bacterium]